MSAVFATYALATNSALASVMAMGILLAVVETVLLIRVAGGFTAPVIPVLGVNAILLSAAAFWPDVRNDSIVSIKLDVPQDELARAAVIGIVFTAALTIGALLAGPRSVDVLRMRRLGTKLAVSNTTLVIFGYAGIALTIYARQGTLLRGVYLDAAGPPWAVSLSNAVTPLSVLLLCLAAFRPGRGRALARLGVAIWALILFGRASRTIAAIPGMLVMGKALGSKRKVRAVAVVLAVVTTLALLQLPLALRVNTGGVGLLTLGDYLLANPHEVFADFSIAAILGNILFSGPLTAVVASRTISAHAFWVSVNPLPGSMVGWPAMRGTLRVDASTPYNAMGELGAHGWAALILVAGVVGFLLALASRLAASLRDSFGLAASLVVLGITAFFSVSILQYNLRSSVRLIWYALAAVGFIWVLSVLLGRRQESRTTGDGSMLEDRRDCP